MPHLPPGSPFEEFFDEFFKNRRGGQGAARTARPQPRKINSLGSGFIIDTAGIVVTNNHVIADADEINVMLNDGTQAQGRDRRHDKKTDLAVLKVKPAKPLTAVKFGDSDKLRLGDWVIAIGNPFSLGGTVTAGIVSARNRDINSGPYDNYIQTDAAINRGNSGGPLFNLDGEVIGVNTAIISPSGGSIGIGFAVPSKTVAGVVDQLQQFGETAPRLARRAHPAGDRRDRRKPQHQAAARRAGRRRRRQGPGKARRHRAGDVIVKFDGKDIKEMRDLSRIVADTPVGKEVDVVMIRKGKEETQQGHARPARGRRQAAAGGRQAKDEPAEKPVTQKALGLDLADAEQGSAHQVQDQGQRQGRASSPASTAPRTPPRSGSRAGDVIVEVAQEAVASAADIKKRIDQLKKDGKKSVLLLVVERRRRIAVRRARACSRARASRLTSSSPGLTRRSS